jgi:hypothetical protein
MCFDHGKEENGRKEWSRRFAARTADMGARTSCQGTTAAQPSPMTLVCIWQETWWWKTLKRTNECIFREPLWLRQRLVSWWCLAGLLSRPFPGSQSPKRNTPSYYYKNRPPWYMKGICFSLFVTFKRSFLPGKFDVLTFILYPQTITRPRLFITIKDEEKSYLQTGLGNLLFFLPVLGVTVSALPSPFRGMFVKPLGPQLLIADFSICVPYTTYTPRTKYILVYKYI